MLRTSGADIDAKDNEGRRAVAYASRNGHKDVVRALVSHQPASTSNPPTAVDDQAPVRTASSMEGAAGGAPDDLAPSSVVENPLAMLVEAARAGDEAKVDEVLRSWPELDVNARHEGKTALMQAVGARRAGVARKLLAEYCADPNALWKEGKQYTCLTLAAGRGNVDLVRLLLEHGAKVHAKDATGWTAVQHALASAEVLAFRSLDVLKAHGADLTATDNEGATPLMLAAYYGKMRVIRYLLANGADPTARNRKGMDVIGYAKESREGRKVVAVLTKTVKAHMERLAAQIEDQGKGEAQMPKNKTWSRQHMMLVEAACAGDEAKVDEVLKLWPELDVNALHGSETALLQAVCKRHVGVVRRLLVEYHADPNVIWVVGNRRTCLMEAAEVGHEELVRLLLAHGANVHAKDVEGCTAVWYAVYDAVASADVVVVRILQLLTAHGADLTAARYDGVTALAWAAFWGRMEVVRYLLANGADPTVRDDIGRDAMAWAKSRPASIEVVAVLNEVVKGHVERLAAQIRGPGEGEAQTCKDKNRTRKHRRKGRKGGGAAVASGAQAGGGLGAVDVNVDAAEVGVARVAGGDEEQQFRQVTAAVAVARLHEGEAESFPEDAEAQGGVTVLVPVEDEVVRNEAPPVELTEEDFDDAPTLFECPISHTIMRDPVMAQDGYSYERSHIETWIRKAVEDGVQPRSPMANEPMDPVLAPNRVLKCLIDEYMERKLMEKKARIAAAAQA